MLSVETTILCKTGAPEGRPLEILTTQIAS